MHRRTSHCRDANRRRGSAGTPLAMQAVVYNIYPDPRKPNPTRNEKKKTPREKESCQVCVMDQSEVRLSHLSSFQIPAEHGGILSRPAASRSTQHDPSLSGWVVCVLHNLRLGRHIIIKLTIGKAIVIREVNHQLWGLRCLDIKCWI